MVERIKEKVSNRVSFSRGGQQLFLKNLLGKSGIRKNKFAKFCGVSERTLTDWIKEKFTLPQDIVKKLSLKFNVPIPKNVTVKPAYWYAEKGATLGGKATIKKYGRICGDEQKRKENWRRWWQEKGRLLKTIENQPQPFNIPKQSVKLAEFIGIMLGDGGITDYQIAITLNKKDDRGYIQFVEKLISELFKVKVGRTIRESVITLTVSRINLVKYCQSIGLVKGNKVKQKIDIPKWVISNEKYTVACLRGLIDTDGSVFTHSYKVNSKWYFYKKISFSSHSGPLISSVKKNMENLGLQPRIAKDGNDIRLESKRDVEKYFKIINSNNPKHRNKFWRVVPNGKAAVC